MAGPWGSGEGGGFCRPGYSATCERVGSIHITVARIERFPGSGRYHVTCTGEPSGTHGAALLQVPSPVTGG